MADTAIDTAGLLEEADADITDANDALQALIALLRACDPATPVQAGRLRGLLQPIASSVNQAADALSVALR